MLSGFSTTPPPQAMTSPLCRDNSSATARSRVRNRPLLEEQDRMQRILELMEKRKAIYNSLPNQVDTTRLTTFQVADVILKLYRDG